MVAVQIRWHFFDFHSVVPTDLTTAGINVKKFHINMWIQPGCKCIRIDINIWLYQITPDHIYVIISRFCGQEPGRRALLDRDMDGRCEVYLAVASFSYFWLVNYYLILHRPPISSPASNPTLSIFCWFSLTKSWVEEHDDSAHLISWFPIRHNSQVLIIYFFCVIIQSVILISSHAIWEWIWRRI